MTTAPNSGKETIEWHYNAIKESNLLGKHSKLLQLFEFLMDHREGLAPTEQVLANAVFGRQDAALSDDSSVRVYMYRLRKKLDEFYAAEGRYFSHRIRIPKGAYSLTFEVCEDKTTRKEARALRLALLPWGLCLLLVLFILFQVSITEQKAETAIPQNQLWQSLRNSTQPIVVLLGDYYLIGQVTDTATGEHLTRYVRDFRVNSASDLSLWKSRKALDFADMKAIDITYLPVSVGVALGNLLDDINSLGRPVKVLNVSEASADIIKGNDIIYIGLISGMGFLGSIVFDSSTLVPGMGYDELVNTINNQRYRTSEPYGRVEDYVYKDYGYVNLLRTNDGLVFTIAGLRDTGLKAVSEVLSETTLPANIQAEFNKPQSELLFAVPGLQNSPIESPKLIPLSGEDASE